MCNSFSYIDTIISAGIGLFGALFGAWVGAKSAAYFQHKQSKAEVLKNVYAQVFSTAMALMNHPSAHTRLAALCAVERACFDCSAESYECMCALLDLAEKVKDEDDAFFSEVERLHQLAHQDIAQYESDKHTRKNRH